MCCPQVEENRNQHKIVKKKREHKRSYCYWNKSKEKETGNVVNSVGISVVAETKGKEKSKEKK